MSLKPNEQKKPDFIAINITPDKKLFCNACGLELLLDHSCGKCGIFYRPEQALHQTVIRGLDGREAGPQSHTIPITFVDTESKPKPSKGKLFDSLEHKGFRWTTYTETNT